MKEEGSDAQAEFSNLRRVGEKELSVALRAIKNTLYARTVFAKFPLLEQVTERLAFHIGDRIMINEVMPIPGRNPTPLLHACIRNAFRRFDLAMNEDDPTPRSVLTAYINGLFSMTYELSFMRVEGSHDTLWDPLGEPFTSWAAKHAPVKINHTEEIQFSDKHPRPTSVRFALLRRILSNEDFALLATHTDIAKVLNEAG